MTIRRKNDGFLTRAEMAKTLGIGKTTLCAWERAGKTRPIKNAKGHFLYPPEEVARLAGGKPIEHLPKARASVSSSAKADGEIAADVFDRLDRGMHVVDIVKELRVAPEAVEALVDHWARLRGIMLVTAEDRRALSSCGVGAVVSGAELVEHVTRCVARAPAACRSCETSIAAFCQECVNACVIRAANKAKKNAERPQATSSTSRRSPTSGTGSAFPGAPVSSRRVEVAPTLNGEAPQPHAGSHPSVEEPDAALWSSESTGSAPPWTPPTG